MGGERLALIPREGGGRFEAEATDRKTGLELFHTQSAGDRQPGRDRAVAIAAGAHPSNCTGNKCSFGVAGE